MWVSFFFCPIHFAGTLAEASIGTGSMPVLSPSSDVIISGSIWRASGKHACALAHAFQQPGPQLNGRR